MWMGIVQGAYIIDRASAIEVYMYIIIAIARNGYKLMSPCDHAL